MNGIAHKLNALLAATMVVLLALPSSAQAERREDVFNVNTSPAKPAQQAPAVPKFTNPVITPAMAVGPRPRVSVGSSPVEWFAAFDSFINFYKPSHDDRFIMTQNFHQEVERVNAFCAVSAKLAKTYRILAKKLESMPIPNSMPEARKYRDLHVAWYNDCALLYEDMVRPRRPARTQEELNAIIKDLDERSLGLKDSFETLSMMDLDLRKKNGVRPNDALTEYTNSPTK